MEQTTRLTISFFDWLFAQSSVQHYSFEVPSADPVTSLSRQILGPNNKRIGLIVSAHQLNVFSISFGEPLALGAGLVFWPVNYPGPPQVGANPLVFDVRQLGSGIVRPVFGVSGPPNAFLNALEVNAHVDWVEEFNQRVAPTLTPLRSEIINRHILREQRKLREAIRRLEREVLKASDEENAARRAHPRPSLPSFPPSSPPESDHSGPQS